jgi:hypothetical protein
MERVKTLSHPGTEKTRQCHPGRTAFGAARSPTDLASDDQRTNTAFGQIVVGRHARIRHEDKEFGQKVFDSFAEGMHESLGPDKRRAHLPQLLLEGVLERDPLGVLFREGQQRVRDRSSFGSLVDLLDFFDPLPQLRVIGMQLFEFVDVAQEMNPTPLMQALMDVVAGVKIAAQDSLELVADQLLDHFPSAGVMVLVVAHRGSAHTPDVSIEAIFSPSRSARWQSS